jgi:cephalosporin-C deacetylase-like acetyl esterase
MRHLSTGAVFPLKAFLLGVGALAWVANIPSVAAPRPEWIELGKRPGDRMLAEYFRLQVEEIAAGCLKELPTPATFAQWRQEHVKQLREMLGLEPLPERTALQPVITGTVEVEDVVVEKLYFQSLPGLYVTANLYRPKDVREKLPAILYVCGHSQVRKGNVSFGNKCGYRHYGIALARGGYVCLIIDTVQLGEIEGIHHGTYRYGMWWWNNRGYTPAGVEAWNSIRAIDYLQSRPEVDPERIGISGRSGGGAYSWWTAALDERVKAAVPVAGITDLADHVLDGCVEGHCDCMYIVNTYRWDYPMVAALVAPRALLIGNTDDDDIFPEDGVRRLFEKVRKVYAALGAEENCQLALFPGKHEDVAQLQEATLRWFDRHLKKADRPVEVPLPRLLEPEDLKVFTRLPEDQRNTTIHETFVPKAQPPLPGSRQQWQTMMAQWQEALKAKVFRGWPQQPPALEPTLVAESEAEGVRLSIWEFTSQPAIRLRLYVVAPVVDQLPSRVELHVVDEPGWRRWVAALRCAFEEQLLPEAQVDDAVELPAADLTAFQSLQQNLRENNLWMMAFPPRGIGPSAWNPAERKRVQIERRFMLVGQTSDGMRVWDVCRATELLRRMPSIKEVPLTLVGQGPMGVVGLYAAIFQPGVARLEVIQPPTEHRQGPIFLNVERFLDVPQAVAMAADRIPVTLRTTDEKAWDYPQKVLALLGRADHLKIVAEPAAEK